MKPIYIQVSDIDLGQVKEENDLLKKQNALLKRKVERLEVDRISKDVHILLQKWLDRPIPEFQNSEQDAMTFAKAVTRYIYRQLQ